MSSTTHANGQRPGLTGLNSLALPQVGPTETVTATTEAAQFETVEAKQGWWERLTAPKPAKPPKPPKAAKPLSRRQQRRKAKVDTKARKAAALDAAGVQQMTALARLAAIAILLGAIGIGVVAFAASFETVTNAMRPEFGKAAWTVTVVADLAILVVSGLDILLAWMRMRIPWLRLIPWSLTVAIVYLNVASANDTAAKFLVAHALPPLMFVVLIEVLRHVISIRAGIVAGDISDGPRIPRWLVAPIETVQLWRWMALEKKQLKTMAEAKEFHQARVLAVVAMRERWGWLWRITAPASLKTRHSLRILTAEEADAYVEKDKTGKKKDKAEPAGAASTAVPAAKQSKPRKSKSGKTAQQKVSDDEALTAIRANLNPDGRIGVKAAKRAAGIGVDRARNLLEANNLRATES